MAKRLGRGLDHLMGDSGQEDAVPGRGEEPPQGGTVAVDLVDASPYQPRQGMDAGRLEGLKASLREHGVLQPIVVRRVGDRFEVVVGARRLRAAREVGMEEVPAVVRDVADDRMLEIALIENLQREDLDAIEKAQSFRVYLAETGLTQEEASKRLGLDRSTIANMIRLLELPEEVQGLVRHGMVAMGHARALLALEDGKRQVALAERVAREGLSVRQVERLVGAFTPSRRRRTPGRKKSAEVRSLEARLREALGTKVTVEEGAKAGTGRIVIEFYSHEDLERLLEVLG